VTQVTVAIKRDKCYTSTTKIKGYIAICFAAGVIGALAVIVFSLVLYYTGISASLGAGTPPKLAAPDIYRPLFWGGLWGLPFGLITWKRERCYYLIGWLYFLAPVLALYFYFCPDARARRIWSKQRVALHVLPSARQRAVRNSHRCSREVALSSDFGPLISDFCSRFSVSASPLSALNPQSCRPRGDAFTSLRRRSR
jgi:hypothetical protein